MLSELFSSVNDTLFSSAQALKLAIIVEIKSDNIILITFFKIFPSNLSIYFLLDLLYASYFSLDYENNFNKKLQLTSKSESTRHSSNPILMDESKQC